MGQDHARIGEDLEQRAGPQEMRRVLEQPGLLALGVADQSQVVGQSPVARELVLREIPVVVGRQIEERGQLVRDEGLHHQGETFVDVPGLDAVERDGARARRFERLRAFDGGPIEGMSGPRVTGRADERVRDDPALEALEAGIEGQDLMQRGRPGARDAGDDDRRDDRLAKAFGHGLPTGLGMQSPDQAGQGEREGHCPSPWIVGQVDLEGFDDAGETLVVVVAAEIVESRGLAGRVVERRTEIGIALRDGVAHADRLDVARIRLTSDPSGSPRRPACA